jgi:hypothetical protein
VAGRVTSVSGAPQAGALVRIEAVGVGTATGQDGRYRLVVPASRYTEGQPVTLTASRVGLASSSRQVALKGGDTATVNFTLGADVLQLARGARGDDPHGDRAEFIRLVQSYQRIAHLWDRVRSGSEVARR